MEVDQSQEGDFCLARAILAFRGGAPALCLHQSLLTLQSKRLRLAGCRFDGAGSMEPGLFLAALGKSPS